MAHDLKSLTIKRPYSEFQLNSINIAPNNNSHAFTQMPTELIIQILQDLPSDDILRLSLASKDIKVMITNVKLWKYLFSRDFKIDLPKDFSIKTCNDYYNKYYKYHTNLSNGVYASNTVTIMPSRPKSIGHCSAIGDGKFFLYSEEIDYFSDDQMNPDEQMEPHYTISEYTANKLGAPIHRINKETGERLRLVACRPLIMAWDLKTGNSLGVFAELPFMIEKLIIADGKLLCVSEDKYKLTILDLKTKNCLATLTPGEEESIASCTASKDKIYIGSDEGNVIVFDLNKSAFSDTLETDDNFKAGNDPGYSDRVSIIAAGAGKVFACSSEGMRTRICGQYSDNYKTIDITNISGATADDDTIFVSSYIRFKRHLSILDWEGNHKSTIPFNLDSVKGRSSFTIDGNGRLFTTPGDLYGYSFKTMFKSLEYDYSKREFLFRQMRDIPIEIWDFKAENSEVFKEIASKLNWDGQFSADAIARFLRMPKAAKEKIYENLCLINARNGISSTPEGLKREIEGYVQSTQPVDNPFQMVGDLPSLLDYENITTAPTRFTVNKSLRNLRLAIEDYLRKRDKKIQHPPKNSSNEIDMLDGGEWINLWYGGE